MLENLELLKNCWSCFSKIFISKKPFAQKSWNFYRMILRYCRFKFVNIMISRGRVGPQWKGSQILLYTGYSLLSCLDICIWYSKDCLKIFLITYGYCCLGEQCGPWVSCLVKFTSSNKIHIPVFVYSFIMQYLLILRIINVLRQVYIIALWWNTSVIITNAISTNMEYSGTEEKTWLGI